MYWNSESKCSHKTLVMNFWSPEISPWNQICYCADFMHCNKIDASVLFVGVQEFCLHFWKCQKNQLVWMCLSFLDISYFWWSDLILFFLEKCVKNWWDVGFGLSVMIKMRWRKCMMNHTWSSYTVCLNKGLINNRYLGPAQH